MSGRTEPRSKTQIRTPILILAIGALLVAMWGGLARIGWPLPAAATLAQAHGPLMAVGFLGTLITLERAVAVARPWAYAAAAATAVGAVALIATPNTPAGPALMAIGSLGLLGVFVVVLRRQLALFTATMAAGAALLLAGNLLWAVGWSIPLVVPFWGGFLLLTIAGERLELSRMALPGRRATALFSGLVSIYLAGVAATVLAPPWGSRMAALAALGISFWLIRFDVARWTIRGRGLPRFAAACMLTGFFWLCVHAVLSLYAPVAMAGPLYDARWHALFLGFVFAMIFGHAPIILPAVLGRPLPFHSRFYVPLAVMQVGLGLRVAGDLIGGPEISAWGGMINAIAILLFLCNTAAALILSRRPSPGGAPRTS